MKGVKTKMELKGIYAPIPTPFHPDGSIAWGALEKNVKKWISSPLQGLVVGGSNGEFPFLSFAERAELTARVASLTNGKIPVVAGVHCPSLTETLELCRAVSAAGADAVLALPPHYYKGQNTVDTLRTYFWKLADSSPVPVVLYNMPANTGVNLTAECVREISSHPSIIGIKDVNKPDFGDSVPINDGEVPVFWACGVTPQAALMASKPPFAITHAPGHMFVCDPKDSDYAIF
jgi:4-hydroxy-2-oxoglutarate aldolase